MAKTKEKAFIPRSGKCPSCSYWVFTRKGKKLLCDGCGELVSELAPTGPRKGL
jgi:ribosomal protein S27E